MTQAELYEEEIKRIVEVIRDQYQPEKIILFGSAARGDLREDSDIDMLIIKESDKPRRQRASDIYGLFRDNMYRVPFEPIVFTPEEFEEAKINNYTFIREIIKDGRLLYEPR